MGKLVDLWDPPSEIKCQSCGYDGGLKNLQHVHELEKTIHDLRYPLRNETDPSGYQLSLVRNVCRFVIILILGSIGFTSISSTITSIWGNESEIPIDIQRFQICVKTSGTSNVEDCLPLLALPIRQYVPIITPLSSEDQTLVLSAETLDDPDEISDQ